MLGRAIYFAAYGVGSVAIYVRQHVSEGLSAARNSHQSTSARNTVAPSLVPIPKDDQTEHLVLELEVVILEMISAAQNDDLLKLHEIGTKQEAILKTLQQDSTWNGERIVQYLAERGNVNLDGPDFQYARSKMHEAERAYGCIAA